MKTALKYLCIIAGVILLNSPLFSQKFDPGPGKTIQMIGQNYIYEYQDYIENVGIIPAGSSHYGEFYAGYINQGDDGYNSAFVKWMNENYPGSYCEVAFSIKDNTRLGGYGTVAPTEPDFNGRAVVDACQAIVNGHWDDEIDQFSNFFKSMSELKFFVRIGYEVSLAVFANSTNQDPGNILNYYSGLGINCLENADQIPEWDLNAYKNAYNYIANRIRNTNNVNNVAFVYHPVRGYWDAYWCYPGSQFVDYVALSFFNHDVCLPMIVNNETLINCPTSQAIDDNSANVFNWAKNTLNKPLMIAESGGMQPPINNSSGFISLINKIKNVVETYDVRVWTFINTDWIGNGWLEQYGWGDTRVQKNSTIKNHWKSVINNSRYIKYTGPGDGDVSNPMIPHAPDDLTAVKNGSSTVVLNWDDNSQNEEIYYIERSTGGGFVLYANVGANVTSYVDNNVYSSVQYHYRVRAYNSYGISKYSNKASSVDGDPPPNCYDGIKNGNEGGVDCGGSCPPCQSNDCSDPVCPDSHPLRLCGQCWESMAQAASAGCTEECDDEDPPPPGTSCYDGIQNGNETGVDCGGSCPPCNATNELYNNVPLLSLSGGADSEKVYFLNVPSGATDLTIQVNGGSGDVDLYTDFENEPTLDSYDCRPYKTGNSESCEVSSPFEGTYYIMLHGYQQYSGVTLTASYNTSSTPPNNCSGSHPFYACGQCWESQTQASSGGCNMNSAKAIFERKEENVSFEKLDNNIHITGLENQLSSYKIVTITGIQLKEGKGNRVDISDLEPGIYILFTNDHKLKFIK